MRFFTLVDYHHLLLALFLGAIAAMVIHLAFRHHSRPVPSVLVFLYLGFAVWAVLYLFYFALLGGPI
jgi:hypothetical protein